MATRDFQLSDRNGGSRPRSLSFAVLLAGATFCYFFPPSVAADSNWAWVRATSIEDDWAVQKGKAKVTIVGTSFTAELFDPDDPETVLYLVRGRIREQRVVAQSETKNSDFGSSKMSGEIRRKKWKGFVETVGRQTITLSDGWNLLGITRELRPETPTGKE